MSVLLWRAALSSAALCLSLLIGCNTSGIYPVEGRVTWKDGSPAKELAGSLIMFEQTEKQASARGQIQPDGSFRLSSNKENDGAKAGEHTVLIVEVGRKPLGGPDGSLLAPGNIDIKYSSPSTSDLRATVKPGKNQITLNVDKAK